MPSCELCCCGRGCVWVSNTEKQFSESFALIQESNSTPVPVFLTSVFSLTYSYRQWGSSHSAMSPPIPSCVASWGLLPPVYGMAGSAPCSTVLVISWRLLLLPQGFCPAALGLSFEFASFNKRSALFLCFLLLAT